MKHVFQFYGKKPQSTGTGRRHVWQDPTEWIGFRAEILISDTDGKGSQGDSVYLEGDGESLRMALTGALRVLDAVEKIERDRLAKLIDPPVSSPQTPEERL